MNQGLIGLGPPMAPPGRLVTVRLFETGTTIRLNALSRYQIAFLSGGGGGANANGNSGTALGGNGGRGWVSMAVPGGTLLPCAIGAAGTGTGSGGETWLGLNKEFGSALGGAGQSNPGTAANGSTARLIVDGSVGPVISSIASGTAGGLAVPTVNTAGRGAGSFSTGGCAPANWNLSATAGCIWLWEYA